MSPSSEIKRTPSKLRDRSNRLSLILFVATIIASLAWVFVSKFVTPEIVRCAYFGSCWSGFNGMVAHQAAHPLSYYLAISLTLSKYLLVAIVFSGLFILVAARPEVQDVFWGEDDPSQTLAKGSWREQLARFVRSREMIVLALIILVALFLRVIDLGAKSFNEDEVFSVLVARYNPYAFLWEVTHLEANMAVYYIALRLWIHIGLSEVSVRSLSVVFALATIPAIYLLARSVFGRRAAVIAALLLAINCFHIEYSQDARSYTLLVLLITLSSLAFLKCIYQNSRGNWVRYIVISSLAIYVHIFAVLVLVSHAVSLSFLPRRIAPWRRFVPSAAAVSFLALPIELLLLFGDKAHLSWVPRTTPKAIYQIFASFAGGDSSIPGFGAAILLLLYFVAIGVGLLGFGFSGQSKEKWKLAFFSTWLFMPILLALLISMREPVFVDRFLIICLPPFIILAAYSLSQLKRRYVIAFLCAVSVLTASRLIAYYESPGQDLRGVAKYVTSAEQPGDIAVIYPFYLESRINYYMETNRSRLTFFAPDSGNGSPDFPPRSERVWFITRATSPPDSANENSAERRLIQASLSTRFREVQREKQFGGLVVTLFQK